MTVEATSETVQQWLDAAVRRWGSKTLAALGEESITFTDFDNWANSIAAVLQARGIEPGDRVLIIAPNRLEVLPLIGACWKLRAIAVPVVAIYRKHELKFIIDDTDPTAIVVQETVGDRRLADEIDECLSESAVSPRARFLFEQEVTTGQWEPLPAHSDAVQDVITVDGHFDSNTECLRLYTSGTTAAPKGVRLASRSVVGSAVTYQEVFKLETGDVGLVLAPVTHIAGLLVALMVPLTCGCSAVMLNRWDPQDAVVAINRHRATWSAGAAVFLSDLVETYERDGVPDHVITKFVSGGANTAPTLIERANALGMRAMRIYGMTETAGAVALADPDAPLERRANWDSPLTPGLEVKVVDDFGDEVPAGVEGNILIRGERLMMGYTNENDNAALLRDGWFDPGDVGLIDASGWMRITGRTKDIINRGGEKFSAPDIEIALMSHPAVGAAAVIGVPHERLGESVCAFVVLRATEQQRTLDGPELATYLIDQGLAKQKVPTEWHLVEHLPTSATGKVQKNVLRSQRELV